MFGFLKKGREDSKTFIEDKVKWFHFMEGFKGLYYEYALSNIFKRYPDYRIEYDEYMESFEYFKELCECCSADFNKRLDKTDDTWIENVYNIIGTNQFAKFINRYKKGKLFEILLILYITEGHKEIDSFPDFIEKWFRDGILILITDQGDEAKEEMKNKFFNEKLGYTYVCKPRNLRFIFEIKSETGEISLSVFHSYYDYFSRFDSLQYSHDSKPIAKCLWTSKTKDGIEATFVPTPLSKEEHKRAHSKDNKDWSIVGARLFDQGIKIKLNLDELCKYEEERNTKRLIKIIRPRNTKFVVREMTGMSNKEYKQLLKDYKENRIKKSSDPYIKEIVDVLANDYCVEVNSDFISYAKILTKPKADSRFKSVAIIDIINAMIKLKNKIKDKEDE